MRRGRVTLLYLLGLRRFAKLLKKEKQAPTFPSIHTVYTSRLQGGFSYVIAELSELWYYDVRNKLRHSANEGKLNMNNKYVQRFLTVVVILSAILFGYAGQWMMSDSKGVMDRIIGFGMIAICIVSLMGMLYHWFEKNVEISGCRLVSDTNGQLVFAVVDDGGQKALPEAHKAARDETSEHRSLWSENDGSYLG